MSSSSDRGLERLARQNLRYLEQAIKPKPEPAAYVQGYDADSGKYVVSVAGKPKLAGAITNGALKTGQQVDLRGKLIDAMPRPLPVQAVTPQKRVAALRGYILFSSFTWLGFLSAYKDGINDLTGAPLGYNEGTGSPSNAEDWTLGEYAEASPANLKLVETLFKLFQVKSYAYNPSVLFPAIDEFLLRPLALAKGIQRQPIFGSLASVNAFFVSINGDNIYNSGNQTDLERLAKKYGVFASVSEFVNVSDFSWLGVTKRFVNSAEWDELDPELTSVWKFGEPRSQITRNLEDELLLGSNGALSPGDRSYLDLSGVTKPHEILAVNVLDLPTIVWVKP